MFSKKLFAQRVQEIRKSHHETQKELGEILREKDQAQGGIDQDDPGAFGRNADR